MSTKRWKQASQHAPGATLSDGSFANTFTAPLIVIAPTVTPPHAPPFPSPAPDARTPFSKTLRPQPLPLTPEQIAANEADIRSLCEKVGQDPTMLLESMPKTYTAATPTLFS